MHVYREKSRAGRRGPGDQRKLLLPVSEHPRNARLMHHFIDNIQSAMHHVALAETSFSAAIPSEQSKSLRQGAAPATNAIGVQLSHIRHQGGGTINSDVVLDYIDPNVLSSHGALFFGHIAAYRHFQV
eukprot:jgi/Tetstr1/458567/TSEL_044970.t1